MKKFATVKIRYFLKGDYVMTPEGVGIVTKNEKQIKNINEIFYSDVLVQHKSGLSANPSNAVRLMGRENLIRISKKEYDEEK